MCCLFSVKNKYGLGHIRDTMLPPPILTLFGPENMRKAGNDVGWHPTQFEEEVSS